MTDPYAVLGVESNASTDDIKKAYKKLAMKHHPDRGGDEATFKGINEAYEKVKDGNYRPEPKFDSTFDFTGSIFDEFMKKHQQQQRINISASLELTDAILGGKKIMSIPVNGKRETFEVKVPAGMQHGQHVKYPKLANGIDVVITFRILPSREWTVDGLNLVKGLELSIWKLILGTQIDVKTITGAKIRLKIPAGTQPNTFMRVPGKGIPATYQYPSGDMLVRIDAKIPDEIPDDLLALIREVDG